MRKKTQMKFILIFLISLTHTFGFTQTQDEINQQAINSYRKADSELNEIYKKILVEYKSDTAFIRNLKVSQRIWISFRNAELKTKYPDRESGYYGSMHPACIASYLEQVTRERIKTLKIWIEGIEEGDICSEPSKTKE